MSPNSPRYFRDLKKLLLDFLKHLYTSKEIASAIPQLPGISLSLYSQLKSSPDRSWKLEIDPPWPIDIVKDKYFDEKGAAYLLVGGIVEVNDYCFKDYSLSTSVVRNSQSSNRTKRLLLSCCEKHYNKKSRVVRRFHFDAREGRIENFESSSHMQFGGLCDRDEIAVMQKEGADLHYCLDNLIEIPRFPYPPIDIIMLLDLLLRQFNTLIDRSFVEAPSWLRLVSRSEDFRIKAYYRKISEYFDHKGDAREVPIKTLFESLCEKDCGF